jgi:nucleoside-diphosphate-sugar epimerase
MSPEREASPGTEFGAAPAAKTVVTGAGGLIGAAVLKPGLGRPLQAVGLFHQAKGLGGDPLKIHIDLTDRERAFRLLDNLEPFSALVHCAAVIPGKRPEFPEPRAAAANRLMDDHVIQYCRARSKRLVYLSSTAVYGPEMTGELVQESRPPAPAGEYAVEKARSERIIAEELIDFCLLRLSAPYGPGQTARTVVSIFLERARSGLDLLFHGSGAREQVFIHAEDAAEAVKLALRPGAPSGVFNIAGSEPVSMKALAELIAGLSGKGVRARPSGLEDAQENYRPRFDLTAAAEQLGWSPRISLAQGLARWLDELESAPCG